MIPFPKLQTFSAIFWVLPSDYSLYEKTILGIVVHLFISKVVTTKVNFPFYKQCSQGATCLFANEPYLRDMLASFFNSNIPLYIEKNPVEKLCKVLEMKMKMYTPVSTKLILEKIKYKVLHCIQHDFIRQRAGLSKHQACIFKCFVKNVLRQIFFLYKSRCCKCSLEIKLFIK